MLLRNVAGCTTGAVLLAVAAWSWHGQLRSSMWPADLRPTIDRYFHFGQWLRTNAPSGSSLGTLEVGILGYWSELPIVDFCGLVTPGVAQHVPQREHVRFAIDTLRPTFVIAHRQPGLMENGLPELLAKHYRLVRQLDDCSLSCRLPEDAGPFAEALARALPVADGGTVRVAEAWPALDRQVYEAALAKHRNGWRLAGPGEVPSVVAYPRLDGQWSVVPIGELAPIVFDAAVLATWQPGNVAASTVVAGVMEHTAGGDLPFVGSRVQVTGPLVAVRARCRARALDGSALGPGQHATLLWTSSSNALADPRHSLHVPLPSTEVEFEVEFRLPAQRFPHGEVLDQVYLSPVAVRCVFAVLRVELVRY